MSHKRSVAAAVLALLFSIPASAAAPNLKVVSFTGEVQIKIGDKLISVIPGVEAPEIPVGAEVKIVSGEAVFQAGDTAVSGSAGANFTFSAKEAAGGLTISIAPAADSRPVTVASGGHSAVVAAGSAANVVKDAKGGVSITAAAGSIAVTKPDGSTVRVTAGESVMIAKAPEPKPEAKPEAAPTEEGAPASYDTGTPPPPQTTLRDEVVEEEEGVDTVVSPSSP